MSDARRHTGIPDQRAESAGGGDLWEVQFNDRAPSPHLPGVFRVLAEGRTIQGATRRALELAADAGRDATRLTFLGGHVAFRAGERKEGVIS